MPLADRRRAQWKALTRRAHRGKNAEAFLNSALKKREPFFRFPPFAHSYHVQNNRHPAAVT